MIVNTNIKIQTHSLCFYYYKQKVLLDINLQLPANKITAITGPSGSGKTTILDLIIGLLQPACGKVLVDEVPLQDLDMHRWRRSIGYVPQRIEVPEVMPLRVCDFLNVIGSYSIDQCQQKLDEVSCGYLLYSPMQSISGGEMQRVLLARALLKKPELLVLDEPASGMDIIGQQALYETIRNIRDKHNCGILMVSHDLHLVMAATDRVICLNTHVCCTGHPDDVSEHPEYLKLFGDAIDGLALYSHHHDHEHDIHGNIVESEHCQSCEHHQGKNDG